MPDENKELRDRLCRFLAKRSPCFTFKQIHEFAFWADEVVEWHKDELRKAAETSGKKEG